MTLDCHSPIGTGQRRGWWRPWRGGSGEQRSNRQARPAWNTQCMPSAHPRCCRHTTGRTFPAAMKPRQQSNLTAYNWKLRTKLHLILVVPPLAFHYLIRPYLNQLQSPYLNSSCLTYHTSHCHNTTRSYFPYHSWKSTLLTMSLLALVPTTDAVNHSRSSTLLTTLYKQL